VVNSGAIGIEFLSFITISFSSLLLPNLEIRFIFTIIIYSFVFHSQKRTKKKNIAVSVDFSNADEVALNSAFNWEGLLQNTL
jgi:hypothetical protein